MLPGSTVGLPVRSSRHRFAPRPEPESFVHRAPIRAVRPSAVAPISLLLLCACGGAGTPESAVAPASTSPAITAADLRTRLYAFADDSMQGRRSGTPGNVKGTDWIAAEARRIGLEPAGEDGGWFQTVPILRRDARFRHRAHGRGTDVQGVDRHDPPRPGHRRAAGGRRPRDLRRDLGRHAHHPRAGGGQAGGGDVPPEGRRARGECQPGSDHPALQHRGRHRGGDARRGRSLGPDRSRGHGGASSPAAAAAAATPLPRPPPSSTAPRASPRR